MSSHRTDASAIPVLFEHLVDDAAVFPPGNAPLPDAVRAHVAYRDEQYARLVGPFLCPASRLADLRATLAPDQVLDLRVVVDTGISGLGDAVAALGRDDASARYDKHGIEIALRADSDLGGAARRLAVALRGVALDPGANVFVEVPRGPSIANALDVLAEEGLYAKLRTGGADAAAHPSEQEVADFIIGCLDREVGFKLTAGLHHAVRHTEAGSGFEQHGFLNVMLAVDAALDGADHDGVAAELGRRDTAEVARRISALDETRARRIRRSFRSYGSCSITEPVDDLLALSLLDLARAADTAAHVDLSGAQRALTSPGPDNSPGSESSGAHTSPEGDNR